MSGGLVPEEPHGVDETGPDRSKTPYLQLTLTLGSGEDMGVK